MKFSVTVKRNELPELIRALADARQVDKPLREIGFGWLQLVRTGFALSRDPYGQAWLPVKRGGQPLLRTGSLLRDRFAFQANATDVAVGTNVKIAEYHQQGTRPYQILPVRKEALAWQGALHPTRGVLHPGLPKRRMLPERQQGLPTQYQDVVQRAFQKLLDLRKRSA